MENTSTGRRRARTSLLGKTAAKTARQAGSMTGAVRTTGGVRLERDGETHRRDCECPRCDAGFAPSDHERQLAERRGEARRGRAIAAREQARRQERERLRRLELQAYFRERNAATDAEVTRLRTLRERSLADRRLDLLLRLRTDGVPLETALAQVEAAMPAGSPFSRADNDNGAPVDARDAEVGGPSRD